MAFSRRGGGDSGNLPADSSGYVTCDPLAMGVAVEPGIVMSSERVYCEVEVQGSSHLT